MVLSNKFRHLALLLTASGLASAAPAAYGNLSKHYALEAIQATNTLQKLFYNGTSGLYFAINSTNNSTAPVWWNSANCITTLADLTAIDGSVSNTTNPIFANSFENAPAYVLNQKKIDPQNTCIGQWPWTCPPGVEPEEITPGGFDNDFFDDAGWWGLAWVSVFDVTQDETYLNQAVDIFNRMLSEGYNATCGAMWWNKEHEQQNAITNELFLSLAAHIGNRVDNSDYYRGWATKQWDWFQNSGLIQPSGLVVDTLNNATCQANTNDPSFSYNQGVILGGLIELNKLDPNGTYIDIANTIAKAAIANLSDANGILTEFNSNGNPDLGLDLPTFKGVFARNLQFLQQETKDSSYASYIRKNADSIWNTDRSTINGTLGTVWDQYFGQDLPQGHCAAMDMLVAAAAVS
ncbi:Six-hairpin glycosidase [Rhizodiscina lignyota]|uniref:Six-hairpin glycosidase n=1 Tax=Rhizodiscina lignyota TaxID=1504668 RepID=A0A9P4IDW6_9PEZI|nr:Six-hairpin glycosidase [Rhizodiscina lignyota]